MPPQMHAPYSSMMTNPAVQSMLYNTGGNTGTTAVNPKSNESVVLSDQAMNAATPAESPEPEASNMSKDVGDRHKEAASMCLMREILQMIPPETTVPENGDGIPQQAQSPTPTAVSFRDVIDRASSHNMNHNRSAPSNMRSSEPPKSQNVMTVMSPITMCFERMLGAGKFLALRRNVSGIMHASVISQSFFFYALMIAEAIKTPGSVAMSSSTKKRGPLIKKVLPLNTSTGINVVRNKRKTIDGVTNPFDEIQEDPDLERLVILQMAMQRNQQFQSLTEGPNRDSLPPLPPPPKREVSRIIKEGFFWREYPACEQILYNHMDRYYEISAIQKNYKVQQYFNNVLVEEVRKAAHDSGFTVDPEFCDKMLRDRIRCFYKTHLQNAKKRLATLMKHSDSYENQCLVAVFIRCVRNPDLSFEESVAMANTVTELDQENVDSNSIISKKRIVDEKRKSIGIGVSNHMDANHPFGSMSKIDTLV